MVIQNLLQRLICLMGSYGLYCRSTYNTEASCYDDEFDSESVGDLDSDYIHVYK